VLLALTSGVAEASWSRSHGAVVAGKRPGVPCGGRAGACAATSVSDLLMPARASGRTLPRVKDILKLVGLVSRGAVLSWAIKVTDEYAEWFRRLIKEDLGSASQVAQAVAALRDAGPTLGRPLVDRLKGSELHHLKELRPGSGGRSEIRIIFAFDPTRSALLLLGGDKAGNWERWYSGNISLAEQLYRDYTGDTED